MKLIIAKPSPYARKARIALLEKGLDCEIVVDNPWLPDTRVAEANPLGKVPALLLDDGTVVHDSKVIVEYLETLGVPPILIPAAPRERIEGIAELERLLAGKEWFTDSGFGLAEIATVCALDYVDFRYPDYQWRPHAPGLLALHERLSARQSFRSTKPQPQTLPGL